MISFNDYLLVELAMGGKKLSSKQIIKKIKKQGRSSTLRDWEKIFKKFSPKELHSKDQLRGMLPQTVKTDDIVALFAEDVDLVEKLDPRKHDIGDYIDDFMKSDAPQFKGKSKEKIRDMALAAYRAARREAGLDEGLSTKDKAELYRLTTLAMKAGAGTKKQKDIIQKLNVIRLKNKMKPIREDDNEKTT